MKPFRHVNASTVEEAVNILKDSNGRAAVIAGGPISSVFSKIAFFLLTPKFW